MYKNKKLKRKVAIMKEDALNITPTVTEEQIDSTSMSPEQKLLALQIFIDTLNGIQYL